MAGRLILVTGGGRSGKSRYAQRLGEAAPTPRLFVATCPIMDDEMRARIERHQRERQAGAWTTVEEQLDLIGVLDRHVDARFVLVDCLTLWVNNLMFVQAREAGDSGARGERPEGEGAGLDANAVSEDQMTDAASRVADAATRHPGDVVFVTNEVGLGIIPEHPVVRHYRDLVGRCNQAIAAAADQVVLLVAGVPIVIKG